MTKLGQHFLKSKSIIDKIVEAADIKKDNTVLEIGPGRGILTEALLKKAKKVIAVEKDEKLFEFLKKKFENKSNLHLIHEDILKIVPILPSKIEDPRFPKEIGKNYKIVANIPYYITGAILKKILSSNPPFGEQPDLIVLMVQREVAQRIVAKPPKMSMLSVSVQVYGQPKIIGRVSKGYFSPPPKVDSAIIKIDNISRNFFNQLTEREFFKLVSKGFSHKRKMLKNNLGVSEEILKKAGLSMKARAQELSIDDWKRLYGQIH